MNLLKPKEIKLVDNDGIERVYILHKLPYLEAREIAAQYFSSALPKIGDYRLNEKMLYKLMNFITVEINGQQIRLSTPDMINNHVPDIETGIRLEFLEMDHNVGFFRNGTASNFWENAVQSLIAKISAILTQSQVPSSPTEKPLSTN